ncbi:MAG: hypothetical protein JSW64_13135 [Candidatus Zixiibacteriota bacterium]|nr:MAG: hypothetical protein JSW64_13135 [candidate division Zixibacteria bacterium]
MPRAEKFLLACILVFSLVLSCGDNGIESANSPPNAPSNPSPADGALNQPIDVNLSWECSDPNGDDLIYNIYFGNSSMPPLLQSGQTANTYDPGTLQMGTT